MHTADEILAGVLHAIAAERGKGLKETAEWLAVHHEWEEVPTRTRFYRSLRGLLLNEPLDLPQIHKLINGPDGVVLHGFGGFGAQLNAFFRGDRAADTIHDLIGDGTQTPSAQKIDKFIEDAVSLAFHGKGGRPQNRSGAALFCSVLLTAAFPDAFVDFRQDRWKKMQEDFDLEPFPSGAAYGEMLHWAGRAARELGATRTFRAHFEAFEAEHPNWVVAGLARLFTRKGHLQEIIKHLNEDGKRGCQGMTVTPAQVWNVLQNHKPQVILQGPPGSGKTYLAEQVVKHVATGQDLETCRLARLQGAAPLEGTRVLWDIVQFHPSYGYEDFVRGLATVPTDKGIVFQAQDRILAQAARVAGAHPQIPVVLILDEINRADLARVLGELIYALEYRGQPVACPYAAGDPPDRTLCLPPNLYLIGTMNTADRSIALVDYAIRRRFAFISVPPSVSVVDVFYKSPDLHAGELPAATRLGPKVTALYQAVYDLFDDVPDADDIRIGHSYFVVRGTRDGQPLSQEEWANAIAFRFAYEVVPMVAEYRKERRLRDARDKVEKQGERPEFSLQVQRQSEIRSAVKQWLAQE